MKVQTRKIVKETKHWFNPDTEKEESYEVEYENGYVQEIEFEPSDVNAFSTNKSVRLIGIGKNLYPLTLKSWKQTKKELSRMGILQKFDLSKAN